MTAKDCLGTIRRRWYVLAAAMIFTVCGVWTVHSRPITYQGCDSLYLSFAKLSTADNAYVANSPSMAMTTNMVLQAMMSQRIRHGVYDHGLTASYQVTQTNTGSVQFPSYTQPTAQICSSARDPQMVQETTTYVTEEFREQLYKMQTQEDVPPQSLIDATVLSSAIPLPILGHQTQAYLGITLLGIVGGMALVFWSDPVLKRLGG